MFLYYFSIALTILANALYHLFQKSISAQANPFVSLIFTYITGIIVCLIFLPFYPNQNGLLASFKEVNWASFALGFAIVGLEVGFLLAYRAGWNINLAAIFSNVAVTLVLIPIGFLLFKEKLTIISSLGIGFSILGLILINHK